MTHPEILVLQHFVDEIRRKGKADEETAEILITFQEKLP